MVKGTAATLVDSKESRTKTDRIRLNSVLERGWKGIIFGVCDQSIEEL